MKELYGGLFGIMFKKFIKLIATAIYTNHFPLLKLFYPVSHSVDKKNCGNEITP